MRVVEAAEGIAGAYAGKLLADQGAEVVKVERSGGDPMRRWSAATPDEPTGGTRPWPGGVDRAAVLVTPTLENHEWP